LETRHIRNGSGRLPPLPLSESENLHRTKIINKLKFLTELDGQSGKIKKMSVHSQLDCFHNFCPEWAKYITLNLSKLRYLLFNFFKFNAKFSFVNCYWLGLFISQFSYLILKPKLQIHSLTLVPSFSYDFLPPFFFFFFLPIAVIRKRMPANNYYYEDLSELKRELLKK